MQALVGTVHWTAPAHARPPIPSTGHHPLKQPFGSPSSSHPETWPPEKADYVIIRAHLPFKLPCDDQYPDAYLLFASKDAIEALHKIEYVIFHSALQGCSF